MGVVVSSSHGVSAAPSSSGGGLLTLCPCSSVGSLPRQAVLHQLLPQESFPRAAVLHQLLQRGVPPTGCRPSGRDCSSVGPPRGHKSCQQTCSGVGSSLHGATGPARSLLQRGLPTGSQPPVGASTCSGVGSSTGCRWNLCSPSSFLRGLQGDSLPHHGLRHGLQGNLCSGAWSASSPSFCTDLGVCRVSHISSLLSPAAKAPARGFFSLLNYVIP